MSNSKKSWAIWLGGLAAGIAAGAVIYQNREKLGPQKEKLSKLLAELQKTGEEIGQKIKQAGLERVERGKALTKSITDQVN
ncbi:hypothetical protein [Algoriphagus sp. A40]|uniref:hypothetical protein n=1 Tax=Algoriphagus sp. A40 TaxID=1945863 RepID=UPI0009852E2E|nr:hypothetical protein [Algoriphagus sp. A40]OOG73764.1 hypothetical protein B0E43_13040 [Algoriphagus sp. A40]